MSMPSWSLQQHREKPCSPIVARNANASVTPPNWASTLHADMTARRSSDGGAVTSAYASSAPNTAPSDGGDGRQHDAAHERVDDVAVGEANVVQRRMAAVAGERADHHHQRGDDQEDDDEGEEGGPASCRASEPVRQVAVAGAGSRRVSTGVASG